MGKRADSAVWACVLIASTGCATARSVQRPRSATEPAPAESARPGPAHDTAHQAPRAPDDLDLASLEGLDGRPASTPAEACTAADLEDPLLELDVVDAAERRRRGLPVCPVARYGKCGTALRPKATRQRRAPRAE